MPVCRPNSAKPRSFPKTKDCICKEGGQCHGLLLSLRESQGESFCVSYPALQFIPKYLNFCQGSMHLEVLQVDVKVSTLNSISTSQGSLVRTHAMMPRFLLLLLLPFLVSICGCTLLSCLKCVREKQKRTGHFQLCPSVSELSVTITIKKITKIIYKEEQLMVTHEIMLALLL